MTIIRRGGLDGGVQVWPQAFLSPNPIIALDLQNNLKQQIGGVAVFEMP